MSHAGVLRHFPSKDELLVAILDRLTRSAARQSRDGVRPDPREYLHLVADYTVARPGLIRLTVVLLGEATDPRHPAHQYVADRLAGVKSAVEPLFGEDRSVDLVATWNGLQLLFLYLADRVEPALQWTAAAEALEAVPASGAPAAVDARIRREPAAVADTVEARIIAAAATSFDAIGFRGSALREIAASVGISQGALLYHFPTKTDLLKAVLEGRDNDDSLPWVLGTTALDYLYGMYLQALHNERNPGITRLFTVLACEATDPLHPAHGYLVDRYDRFHAELCSVFEALAAEGLTRAGLDHESAAFRVIALWDGLGMQRPYWADPVGIPERLRRALNELLTVELPREEPQE